MTQTFSDSIWSGHEDWDIVDNMDWSEFSKEKICPTCSRKLQQGQMLCVCGSYRVVPTFQHLTYKEQPYHKLL